jgi:hypothetical protein
VVCASLLLAGCTSGGGRTGADAAFLSDVHAAAPDVSAYRNDGALVRLGRAVCDAFAAGAGFEQIADRLTIEEGSRPLPSEVLGAVITASADDLCPRYRSRVSGS